MKTKIELPENFNIEENSRELKETLSVYDSEMLIVEITDLITKIEPPRMNIFPFGGLNSPFRQLTYIGSLNLTSNVDAIEKNTISEKEWLKIVSQMITVRAGYYEGLLENRKPEEVKNDAEFYDYYKIAMPIFDNVFDMGFLNYEEQIIEKTRILFTPNDKIIEENYGLKTSDFINIYNLIDDLFLKNFNFPLELIKTDFEIENFWKIFKSSNFDEKLLDYSGENENLKKFIYFLQNKSERYSINIEDLYNKYDNDKINSFLNIFTIERNNNDNFLYYTQENIILQKPLFKLKNAKILIIDRSTLINSIFRYLEKFLLNSTSKENFETRRGKWLQDKTEKILKGYFKKECHIFNEYKVNDKGQDILCLSKGGLVLIIENKAVKEVTFSGFPDTINIFKKYVKKFKKSIREGYEQAWRIKELFLYEDNFELEMNNKEKIKINARKYHNIFSIIITMDRYREPQINTSELLELNEDDNHYPLSMSIDDFEVLMLSLKKLKIGIGTFINLMEKRQKLQGRISSNDELEIWATLIKDKDFKIPDDKKYLFKPNPKSANLFDLLYENGLGFENEKLYTEKKHKKFLIVNSVENH